MIFKLEQSGKSDVGFIAQEVAEVPPDNGHADSQRHKSLGYSKIVPLLVEALKEQEDRIVRLESLVEQLKKD